MSAQPDRSIEFVLGGARSGKTRFALKCAEETGLVPFYVATATAFDDEMQARIAAHKTERNARWTTVEAPLALPQAIAAHGRPDHVLLVDCLTLWLNNLMFGEEDVEAATEKLVACLAAAHGHVILVSNEIGLGLVPETSLGRRFRDAQGRLNQRIAAAADRVTFVAAGLPLQLKPVR